MKKHYKLFTALFLLVLLSKTTIAQNYTFDNTTDTYTDLTGSISITTAAPWDDPTGTIPIGFDFQLFDTTISTIYLNATGLGSELVPTTTYNGSAPNIFVFGADVIDRGYDFDNEEATTGSMSTISYLKEGTAGSRICKIEWKNVGFYGDLDANPTSSDFINFQLWLYEGSNKVEMRFGSSNVVNYDVALEGQTGPVIGLLSAYNYDTDEQEGDAFTLTGNPSRPMLTKPADIFSSQLSGLPADGAVYTFSPAAVSSVTSLRSSEANVYPNPTIGTIHITTDMKNYEVTLTDLMGKPVNSYATNTTDLDLSSLPSGIYFITLSSDSETNTQRIVKQ